MQEKARICKSSWCYSKCLIHFSIRKKWHILCVSIQVIQSKPVILICSTPTYLRCIANQTRSKYPRSNTTCGERDHQPVEKKLSRSPRPLRAGLTNHRCILDQHTFSPIKARSWPIRPFFQSGSWSVLWCERDFTIKRRQGGLGVKYAMHVVLIMTETEKTVLLSKEVSKQTHHTKHFTIIEFYCIFPTSKSQVDIWYLHNLREHELERTKLPI